MARPSSTIKVTSIGKPDKDIFAAAVQPLFKLYLERERERTKPALRVVSSEQPVPELEDEKPW